MASELERANAEETAASGFDDLWCDPLDPATFCNECGIERGTTGKKQKFCGKACRKKFNERRSPEGIMKRIITGAIMELHVAADLLNKSFHVFRAQNADAKVDLIIDLSAPPKSGDPVESAEPKGKRALRVEVKTGRLGESYGKPTVTFSGDSKDDQINRPYDILAVVLDGGEIAYNPSPSDWKNDPFPGLAVETTKRTFPYIPTTSGQDHRIKKVRVSKDCKALQVTLRDTTVISLPVGLFCELDGKTLDELRMVVQRDGYVARWPKLNLEATAEQLFHGQLKLKRAPSDPPPIPIDSGKTEPLKVTP
jgi:hypothetical protein